MTKPKFLADLVAFIEEILNGKLHFLCMCYVTCTNLSRETIFSLRKPKSFFLKSKDVTEIIQIKYTLFNISNQFISNQYWTAKIISNF